MRKRRRKRRKKAYKQIKLWKWGKKEARSAVAKAVRNGKIVYSHRCQECGSYPTKTQMHHHRGYRKENWLNVIELCKPCHVIADKISRKIRNALAEKHKEELKNDKSGRSTEESIPDNSDN